MNFDYKSSVVTLLNIFIIFTFSISILLVINSLYNLRLIVSDTDESIYRSDYNKYKSIRELLGYKILMNSYKSESESENYDDTYLTLNTNTFLLRLSIDSTIIIAIILGSLTVMALLCYMNIKDIGKSISEILSEKFPLILTSIGLLVVLITFFLIKKEEVKSYKIDRLETDKTVENNFIKNYLIYYDGIHSLDVNGTKLSQMPIIKIDDIKTAIIISAKEKNIIFDSILNKLKYLDKYNIGNEDSLKNEKVRIEKIAKDKTVYDDKHKINNGSEIKLEENIISYCYYFTVINKDNNVDPVKLIYEFIKRVKSEILAKPSDDTNTKNFHENTIGSFGENFKFLFNKIIKPIMTIFPYNSDDYGKESQDYKHENIFIESLYTCDYIKDKGDDENFVKDINDNMNSAKAEKKAILIAIVATFMVILVAIPFYLNYAKLSIYGKWTYLDNIKRDSGMLSGASNYFANLLKFNKIVAAKKHE